MSECTAGALYQTATQRREKHIVRRSKLKAKGNIGVDRTLRFMRASQRKYNALRHEGRRYS
jgi:hypothetical protein